MEPIQTKVYSTVQEQVAATSQQRSSETPSDLASHSRDSSNTYSTAESLDKPTFIPSPSKNTASQNVDADVQRQSNSSHTFSTSTNANSTDGGSPSSSRPSLATMLCFCALTLSIFLVALDTVLIPTALPSISLDFHIPDSLYAWTGSAYLLANAASIPFWGKLSDVFGRKPIILISNAIFLGGSLVCAVSISATMLVAGRAVQGLGGGGVNVLVYVCVADMFAIRDRSFYMGIVGAMYAVASALGPVIGGVFAQKLNWRWCFYINLPLVSIALVTLYFTVRRNDTRIPFMTGMKSFDWPGTFTILAATILLLVGLQLGGTSSYSSPSVICLLVFGSLSFLLFPLTQWWDEKRGGSPIMPLRIFRDISNLSALGVCACDALVFNSVAYFLPLYFQLVLSSSPSTSGVYMLAVAVPLAIVSFLGGWIINKTGRYLEVLQAGLALMTVGVGLFILFPTTLNLGMIVGFLVIIGIGFGPNFSTPLIALQTRIREADIAVGTSAFGFVRMVSGAIGVVVGQVVFQLLMKPHYGAFRDVGLSVEFADTLAGGEAISQASKIALLSGMQRGAVKGGLNEALRGTWIFFTVVSGLGLCVSFGIARKKLAREDGEKQGTAHRGVDEEVGMGIVDMEREK